MATDSAMSCTFEAAGIWATCALQRAQKNPARAMTKTSYPQSGQCNGLCSAAMPDSFIAELLLGEEGAASTGTLDRKCEQLLGPDRRSPRYDDRRLVYNVRKRSPVPDKRDVQFRSRAAKEACGLNSQPRFLLRDETGALASHCFELVRIEDGDLAPAVTDDLVLLQG